MNMPAPPGSVARFGKGIIGRNAHDLCSTGLRSAVSRIYNPQGVKSSITTGGSARRRLKICDTAGYNPALRRSGGERCQRNPARKKFQHFSVSGIYNSVKGILNRFPALFLCFAALGGHNMRAQTALPSFGSLPAANHTQAKLVLSADTAKPGDTIWAGVDMKMDTDWHTYWRNPGAAGMATKIEWELPPGINAGEIQWPLPEKIPPIEVTTYGYENEVMLLVPLTLASNLPVGALDLKANVSWLECKDVCIPASQELEAKLNIGSETKITPEAATIESWRQKVPQPAKDWSFHAWWEKPENGDTRPLIIAGNYTGVLVRKLPADFDFFPDASDAYEVQAATTNLSIANTDFAFQKIVKKYSGDWPKEVSGVLVSEIGDARSGNAVKLAVADKAPAGENVFAPAPALPLMLLYALIGGLILNIMPCVLPVIALKILGFVSEARSEPRRIRNLGFIYALGVLVSFLALAGVVIGVKAAGHHAGWGMQFGSPVFVVCLTMLVTARRAESVRCV